MAADVSAPTAASEVGTPASPATGGRRVGWSLAALALGGFGIGTTEFVTMGVLPDVAADLHISIPAAGHLVSAYALGVVVGAPLFAVLGARLGRTVLLTALMTAFTLGNLASALAPNATSLLLARFASGLPHGAYFGIGSVVAASLVPPERRARAVSMMIAGLTVANVVGVPLSTLLGQAFGWRATYWTVTAIGVATVLALLRLVPPVAAGDGASPRRELGAFCHLQVWLALATGAIGFGGFFAVFSYITPTLTDVAGYREAAVPIVLALFGVGMTIGNIAGGRLADWSVMKTICIGLSATAAVLLLFTWTAHYVVPAAITVFLLGATGSMMVPALQTRLMDVAHDAQSLAAAMNHSALNLANALGAFLGGLVIDAGLGYTAPAFVGVGLALGGLVVVAASLLVDVRSRQRRGDRAEV